MWHEKSLSTASSPSNPLFPSASTIPALIQFYSQDTGSPLVVEIAEIRVADDEKTALTTYTNPPNTYRHFVDDEILRLWLPQISQLITWRPTIHHRISIGRWNPSLHGYSYFLSTLKIPLLSTENRLIPTSMSTTISVPLPPPLTASSDFLQDEPTSYVPQHLQNKLNQSTPPPKIDTPWLSEKYDGHWTMQTSNKN